MRLPITLMLLLALTIRADAQDKPPHIHGLADKVKASADGKGGSIYVEAPKGAKFAYDKAMVRVNDKTRIQKMNGKLVEDATFAEIKNGTKVSIWFTGPVAESYPVQATAGRIIIFPEKNDK
jgi:uncharacterized protein DUF3221